MKISFEKWIEENKMAQSAVKLFRESVMCYKISAYRSAFIMAYCGFHIILRDRILISEHKPAEISDDLWNGIRNDLLNDDTWDMGLTKCFKCEKSNEKSNGKSNRIFAINNSIAAQYNALRTYRNTCAHGKDGNISYYHVELLWGFIQENFTKFVVNSGEDGMMQMIEEHFDITINDPNKDVTYLVNNIEANIKDTELDEFIDKLCAFSKKKSGSEFFFTSKYSIAALWDKLICENSRVRNGILSFIKKSSITVITDFVAKYPQTVNELLFDDSFARKLWTGKMFTTPLNDKGWFRILEFMVNNNIVPDNEKEKFGKSVFKLQGPYYEKNEIEVLKKAKYFDYLRNYFFDLSNYNAYGSVIDYANRIAMPLVRYLSDFGLDLKSVECINSIFKFATYGAFFVNINAWMKEDSHIDEYKKIVKENQLEDYSIKFC